MHPRQKAAVSGEACYDGKPCRTCGNTKRYTINASCVDCSNQHAKRFVARRRQEIKELMAQARKA
jgi:hypothetical protein